MVSILLKGRSSISTPVFIKRIKEDTPIMYFNISSVKNQENMIIYYLI